MKKQLWMVQPNNIVIPAGIIMPYNDIAATIPTGWEQYTLADGMSIKGVSGSAGSSTTTSSSIGLGATTTVPNHGGSAATYGFVSSQCTYGGYKCKQKTSGSHSHTMTLNFTPDMEKLQLIKALQEQKTLPVNSALMSLALRNDLTSLLDTSEGLLTADDSSSAGSVASVKSLSCASAGSHYHYLSSGSNPYTNTGAKHETRGSHTHSVDASGIQDSIKRFYLGLYTSAVSEISADSDTIGMWESDTPPDGWTICDGSNGTPDLVDHFIGFNQSKIGTSEGDNTLQIPDIDLASGGSHNHYGSTSQKQMVMYHGTGNAHTHTLASSSVSYEPSNYTLIFVRPL